MEYVDFHSCNAEKYRPACWLQNILQKFPHHPNFAKKKRICWSSKFKLAAKSESLKLCWLYRAAPMYIHTGEENKYISQMKKKQLKNIPSKIDVHNTQLTQAEWCL